MVDPHNNDRDVHGHSTIQDVPERDRGGMGWLPWVLGALLLLGLLWLLTRDNEPDAVVTDPEVTETVAADPMATTTSAATATTAAATVPAVAYSGTELDRYLASTEPLGRAYTLDNVTFASGSAEVPAAAANEISDAAAVLKRYPNARVALTGTADPSGDAAANQKLSADRATAVRDALVKAGSAAGQITTAAAGETGATTARANRKVEMRITAR